MESDAFLWSGGATLRRLRDVATADEKDIIDGADPGSEHIDRMLLL
jgi:hypothetical protein